MGNRIDGFFNMIGNTRIIPNDSPTMNILNNITRCDNDMGIVPDWYGIINPSEPLVIPIMPHDFIWTFASTIWVDYNDQSELEIIKIEGVEIPYHADYYESNLINMPTVKKQLDLMDKSGGIEPLIYVIKLRKTGNRLYIDSITEYE